MASLEAYPEQSPPVAWTEAAQFTFSCNMDVNQAEGAERILQFGGSAPVFALFVLLLIDRRTRMDPRG